MRPLNVSTEVSASICLMAEPVTEAHLTLRQLKDSISRLENICHPGNLQSIEEGAYQRSDTPKITEG